jgi:nitroreductase
VELYDAMRTTPSCRYFTNEPVEDATVHRILDHARFASSGGNRQGWRVVVVTDPAQRSRVADLHRKQWDPYYQHALEGTVGYQGGQSDSKMEHGTQFAINRLKRTDDFAQALDDVPVLMCCYVDLSTLAVTDKDLERQSIVGGGSLYTLIHNILLSCTNEGLGSSLTTLLCAEQAAVDELFGTPDGYALGALIAVGWPVADKQYTKLTRKPVEEIAFRDTWGDAFNA